MALVSTKKSLAYRPEPLLYHREVYSYVTKCFPDAEFAIQYESTDFESNVRIIGYKFQGLKQRYPYAEASHSLPKQCLHFDIVQVDNPDARNTFATCFWVTIRSFAPCSPHWCSEGQIQSLMERMIQFMEMLERTSPGEYRLKVCGGDCEASFMFDENQIPGVKMRSLYTLSHGQTRLNALGIQDHLFHSKHVKFNQILQNNFQLRGGTANDVKTFHAYRNLLDVDKIPKTGQVFQGIYKRIRFWNDELCRDSNTVVDMKEVALYCKIIDGHVECVEKHFPSNASQLLKMQRVRAPEPEVQKDAVVKLPTTTALRLSRPYYISAFPTRAQEREEIKQEFRSRRKLHTS